MGEIADKTGLTRSTLYRHLPPRPEEQHTADSMTDTAGSVA